MKKLINLSIIISLSFILSACFSDSGKGVNPDQKLLNTERVYEVDAWGSNPDIIEFTPTGHEYMTCLILVSGGDTAGGMECFPKKVLQAEDNK
jgi:hypothetical protein